MTTEKRLLLEKKLNEFFIDDIVTEDPEGYIHDAIIRDMADAAETVFDAIMTYQKWADKEDI